MTEATKTVLFVAVAAAALLLAFATGPSGKTFNVQELVGEHLNQFDIDAPKRLKVVKFDPETATTSDFEVAEQDGTWVIPSKHNYPADADRQMAKAVNCVSDLEVLRVAAESAEQHASLGVLSPSGGNLKSKEKGVGVQVVMSDSAGDTLVDMIIGKPVKDAPDQRYVRKTDQDIVYVVKLDPEGLSTNFDDWIEGDLLKLNPLDIRHVHIKDYSAELMVTLQGAQVQWDQRGDFSLAYNNSDSKWAAESLQRYDTASKKFVDDPLGPDEELNTDALQGLRDGLDDLRIVDVERKPKGLSADLKAGSDFLKNEAAGSLAARGFAPVALSAGAQAEILSSEGELTCTLQDGVEYVLRFGNLKIDSEEGADSSSNTKGAAASGGKKEKDTNQGIHRYLFVTTRFNADILEKPTNQPLPPLPEGVKSEEEADEQQKSADQDSSAEKDIAAKQGDADKEDDPAKQEAPAKQEDPEKKDSQDKDSQDKSAAKDSSDSNQGADTAAAGEAKKDTPNPAKELKEIVAKRKSIRAENQRHQDEYDQKIEAGNKRVQELNERFGDWYYVIANDVYKKIHLGRGQLVREKKKKDDKAAGSPAGNPLSGLPSGPSTGPPRQTPAASPAPKPAEKAATAPASKPAETSADSATKDNKATDKSAGAGQKPEISKPAEPAAPEKPQKPTAETPAKSTESPPAKPPSS